MSWDVELSKNEIQGKKWKMKKEKQTKTEWGENKKSVKMMLEKKSRQLISLRRWIMGVITRRNGCI